MTRVTESFKVHLSESDIYQMDDAYAEALLAADGISDVDDDGVFVWVDVEVSSDPEPPPAAPAEHEPLFWWITIGALVTGFLVGAIGRWMSAGETGL